MMNTAQINKAFARNQADAFLADTKVIWAGATVLLCDPADLKKVLASFDPARAGLQDKIKLWCVKNSYKCSQIQNGRILL